jgi:hypothetical protein
MHSLATAFDFKSSRFLMQIESLVMQLLPTHPRLWFPSQSLIATEPSPLDFSLAGNDMGPWPLLICARPRRGPEALNVQYNYGQRETLRRLAASILTRPRPAPEPARQIE